LGCVLDGKKIGFDCGEVKYMKSMVNMTDSAEEQVFIAGG
jgi:hypothetical protein